jgi:hypothetical protein
MNDDLPPIEMTPALCTETLDMMIEKLDSVIADFKSQPNVSVTTRSRILRDMAVQRAAMEWARDYIIEAASGRKPN